MSTFTTTEAKISHLLRLIGVRQSPNIIQEFYDLLSNKGNGFNFHIASHEPTNYSGAGSVLLTVDGGFMGDVNGDGDAEDFDAGNFQVSSDGGEYIVSMYMFVDRTGWNGDIEIELTGDTEYLGPSVATTYTIPSDRSLTAIRLDFDSFPSDSGSGSGSGGDGVVNLTFTATAGGTTRSVELSFEQGVK